MMKSGPSVRLAVGTNLLNHVLVCALCTRARARSFFRRSNSGHSHLSAIICDLVTRTRTLDNFRMVRQNLGSASLFVMRVRVGPNFAARNDDAAALIHNIRSSFLPS